MATSQLLWLGSINGRNGVLVAMQHNKRTLQNERGASANIDVTRTLLNYSIASDATPEAIALHAKMEMLKAGIETPRINGVMAVEVLFSLPINRHKQDTKPFFADCHAWVLKSFEGELLSFDVHLDESAPHAHAVILPLINGKMQGSNLKGNRGNLKRLNNLFHEQVAHKYGLSKSERTHLNSEDRQAIEKLVLTRLKADGVMQSCVWPCVRDAIHKNPLQFAQLLSIELVTKGMNKTKSFVDHKRSKGKGSFIS